jgi:hypothetical protein
MQIIRYMFRSYIFPLEDGRTTETADNLKENSKQLLEQSCVGRKPLNLMVWMLGFHTILLRKKDSAESLSYRVDCVSVGVAVRCTLRQP